MIRQFGAYFAGEDTRAGEMVWVDPDDGMIKPYRMNPEPDGFAGLPEHMRPINGEWC